MSLIADRVGKKLRCKRIEKGIHRNRLPSLPICIRPISDRLREERKISP